MARSATGQVVKRQTRDGFSYALRFRAYGRREYVTLGHPQEGWTLEKAERELAATLRDVDAGTWSPTAPEAVVAPADSTFHEFASDWYEARRRELGESTVRGYGIYLSRHLLPFFARHRLSQITVAEVDRYRDTKLRESEKLAQALERWREQLEAASDAQERERLRQERPRKPLGAESINKTLKLLGQILDVAEERDQIPRNPMRVNPRRRKLKVRRPGAVWLDRAHQIDALLTAAGQLDAEAREDRQHVQRRAILATLVYGGLRIGELCDLQWRDVDLAIGRLRVRRSKTDAGARFVELLPALRDELLTHRARRDQAPADAPVFPTATGRRMSERNVAQRVLEPTVARASALLERDGYAPLPDGLTLHKLRHTCCSLLFACGWDLPRVMAQLGHADATTTLRVYAHIMSADEGERERLRALVDGVAGPSALHISESARSVLLEPAQFA